MDTEMHHQPPHDQNAYLWALHILPDGSSTTASELKIPDSGYLWVHLTYDGPQAEKCLSSLGLGEEVIEDLCAFETRPKAVVQDLNVLMFLRAINLNQESQDHPEHMISLRLWSTQGLVITARNSLWKLYSLLDLKKLSEDHQAMPTINDFIIKLVELLTDKIRTAVDGIEDRLAELEAVASCEAFDQKKSGLSQLRRESASIKRYLAPQRDALEFFYRAQKTLDSDQQSWLRDSIERTIRYVEDLDLVRERATLLQEDIRSQIAEQQNQRMYVLSIVTALFLPLSFLTGVFGMNVAGLPGLEQPDAFLALSAAMVAIAIVLLGFMKKYKWL